MKILKLAAVGIFGLLGLVIVVLWVLGGGDGRLRDDATIEIERPAAEIYPWLIEPDRLQRWIEGFEGATPLTEDGPRVGARSLDVVVSGGERFELDTTITEFNPPVLLGVRIDHESFASVARYELREREGRTELTYSTDTQFHGLLFAVLEPIIALSAEAQVQANLERLKAQVEGAPPPVPGGDADAGYPGGG